MITPPKAYGITGVGVDEFDEFSIGCIPYPP